MRDIEKRGYYSYEIEIEKREFYLREKIKVIINMNKIKLHI